MEDTRLKALEEADLREILARALAALDGLAAEPAASDRLVAYADGDTRAACSIRWRRWRWPRAPKNARASRMSGC